jgi:hypothetical protein
VNSYANGKKRITLKLPSQKLFTIHYYKRVQIGVFLGLMFGEPLIIRNLPKVNGVGLPRVVQLNPKTRGKPRR